MTIRPVGSADAVTREFRSRGVARAATLRYRPELVEEAVEVISATFGAQWLSQSESEQVRGPWLGDGHPVRHAFEVAGDVQLVRLLELAEYLKTLRERVTPVVIAALKAEYQHALLQLAFAYRVTRIGGENIALDPPVMGGLGDISFRLAGKEFVAECYRPSTSSRGGPEEEVQILMRSIQDFFDSHWQLLSIGIKIKEPLTASIRKAILSKIRRATSLPIGLPRLFRSQTVDLSLSLTEMTQTGRVRNLLLHPHFAVDRDPDLFACASLAERSRLFSVERDTSGPTLSMVGVWRPVEVKFGSPESIASELARLAKRIRRKMSQTKRSDGAIRLMIVDTWLADGIFELPAERAAVILARELRSGDKASILLVGRAHRDGRDVYRMTPLTDLDPEDPLNVCVRLGSNEGVLRVPEVIEQT